MSSCSFASYIQMRTAAFCSSPITSSSSPSSPSSASSSSGPTSVAASPTLVHLAPSPVPSADSASPHKRQRNKSPDHSSPALPSSAHDSPADSPTTPTLTKSGPKVDPLSYFFAAGSHAHPPTSGGAGAFGGTVPTHAAPSPVCPLRSILCTSHFDETGSLVSTSSPATSSPPISRPLSRRSSTSTSTSLSHSTSTSKSVRFARCTNASVFPTHSTADYDRSPIVPTCEAESLEIYRCPRGGSEGGEGEEGGGWIMCHAKKAGATEVEGGKKKKFVAAAKTGAAGSGSAGGSMMPVEGVRGLFAGSYFEGEERDHPLFPASTPACGSAGVVIPEMVDEEEDEDEGILGEGIGDDGELMEVDDSAEAEDVEATNAAEVEMDPHEEVVDAEVEAEVGAMELLAVSSSSRRRGSDASAHSTATSSASSATSTEESSSHNPHRASSPSTPTSSPPAELANDEEREKDKAQRCAERKKRFGLIGLGKYTRQELFQSHDSLSGF